MIFLNFVILGETIHLSVDCDALISFVFFLRFLGETIHLSVDCDKYWRLR